MTVMAGSGKLKSLNSSQELKSPLGTPELDQFLATINSEIVTDITPARGGNHDTTSSGIQNHQDSPHHQRARPPHYHDSPLPLPQLSQLSISPNSKQRGSAKDLSNDIRRQAMLNKKNCRSDTSLIAPSKLNNSIEAGPNQVSNSPIGPGLDVTPPVGLEDVWFPNTTPRYSLNTTPPIFSLNATPPIGVDLDNTFAHYKQPPPVEYAHNYSYELNDSLSRREDPGSPFNYPESFPNLPNMAIAKRKFNTSYGSDQSSFNHSFNQSFKHVKKRGKLETESFQNGGNEQMDRSLNGTLDLSGPSNSHPMDKTWMPQTSANSDSEDEGSKITSSFLPCLYCTASFIDKTEIVEHITTVHEDKLTDAAAAMKPKVCTNCSDNNEPVAFCDNIHCTDNPFLCNACVSAHSRVVLTRDHGIIFLPKSNSNQNEEDPFMILENILDSVCPDRAVLFQQKDFLDPPKDPKMSNPLRSNLVDKSDADIEEELIKIRHKSCRLAKALNKTSESETSSQSSFSSSSLNSSLAKKTLTEEILADNLLPIFKTNSVEVKTKVAVVMEMLLWMDAVHPNLFCDVRSISGFKSLLTVRDVKSLHMALGSLNQLVNSVGNKGIFFGLKKIKEELSEELDAIRKPSTELDCTRSSAFDTVNIKNMASSILKTIDTLIG